MKISKAYRDSFVTAVMKDLPRPAYEARLKYINEYEVALNNCLPDEVKEVKKRWPRALSVQSVFLDSLTVPYDLSHLAELEGDKRYIYVHTILPEDKPRVPHTDGTQKPYLEELRTRADYRARLKQMADACDTREKLVELLPELEQYMPEPEPVARAALPVAQAGGLVAELCKSGLKVCAKPAKKAPAKPRVKKA